MNKIDQQVKFQRTRRNTAGFLFLD